MIRVLSFIFGEIKYLSFFGICFSFVVIALGGWSRLVDAGLGWPVWPGCYGFVGFPMVLLEVLEKHRLNLIKEQLTLN